MHPTSYDHSCECVFVLLNLNDAALSDCIWQLILLYVRLSCIHYYYCVPKCSFLLTLSFMEQIHCIHRPNVSFPDKYSFKLKTSDQLLMWTNLYNMSLLLIQWKMLCWIPALTVRPDVHIVRFPHLKMWSRQMWTVCLVSWWVKQWGEGGVVEEGLRDSGFWDRMKGEKLGERGLLRQQVLSEAPFDWYSFLINCVQSINKAIFGHPPCNSENYL